MFFNCFIIHRFRALEPNLHSITTLRTVPWGDDIVYYNNYLNMFNMKSTQAKAMKTRSFWYIQRPVGLLEYNVATDQDIALIFCV